MENSSRFTNLYLSVIVCTSVLLPITRSRRDHASLFIFGDSLCDVGNNNYLANATGRANFLPYGETFFKHPTGRFCDGRIIPDFLAAYAKLPLISPYLEPGNHELTGVNFASGGAGALVQTYPGRVIDLNTQLVYFENVEKQFTEKLGEEETKTLLSRALYFFSIGSNDYFSRFSTNSTILQAYSRKEYVGMVIGNLTTVIKDIYKIGGRKFGFINVPPLGRIPFVKALENKKMARGLEEVTELVKLHNNALSKVLKQLQGQLQGFKYSEFDFYTTVAERISHPSKYGFKVGKVACCGSGPYRGVYSCGGKGTGKEYELCDDPSDYLFFDGAHPTEKANKQFAEQMWTGSVDVARPYNLKKLLEP